MSASPSPNSDAAPNTPAEVPITVTDRVYSFLEGEILAGRIPGGTRLRIRQLAALSNTSPMPVREAIARLERAGLAQHEAYKGAVVKTFDEGELLNIYGVRLLLEADAARQGAAGADEDGLTQMRHWLAELKEGFAAHDASRALEADTRILRTLYLGSANSTLCGLIDLLWQQSHLYRLSATSLFADEPSPNWIVRCNEKIIEAAEMGNGEAAAVWVRCSMERAIQDLRRKVRSVAAEPEA